MNIPSTEAEVFNLWRKLHGKTCPQVSEAIGDDGGQVAKWASGGRQTLPVRLVVAFCDWSGEPLESFATPEQVVEARKVAAIVARDHAKSAAG